MSALADRQRPAYRIYRLAWAGLDWLYPPHCGGCGTLGTRWCASCQDSVQILPDTVCERCGNIRKTEGVCGSCRRCPPAFNAVRSWAVFAGPLREAVHRLKYERDVSLGEILAQPLIAMWDRLQWPVDLITPVPIGVDRRLERGYNQSTLLALPLALAAGLPFKSKALSRARSTRSQVGLNANERRDNVAGAFRGEAKIVQGKCILVIDDVATSGATMQACAVALLSAGASSVFGLTLARAAQDPASSGDT